MGKCPSQIWLPVAVSKGMRQCSGRWFELGYNLSWTRSSVSNHGYFPESGRREPSCHQKWPTVGERGVGSHWASPGGNACHWLGSGSKTRPQAGCSSAVVGVWEESWSEDTPWGVYDEWGGPDGVEKLPELHFPLRHPLSALHPQKGRMRICYFSLYPKHIELPP